MTRITSLMYHDVFNESVTESGFQNIGAIKYKISKQSFDEQIKLVSGYCEIHQIEKKNILLTFDDGGKSFLTIIAPILEKYGFKGYFFITTKRINTPGFLTEEDINELNRRGHNIGTHSHSHPKNISVLNDQEIEKEWVKSIKILRDIIKKPVEYASIPGGFFSSCSEKTLFSHGVNYIFTSNPSSAIRFVELKMIIGRYSITKNMSAKEVEDILKPFSITRFSLTTKWNILRILKLILQNYYFDLRDNLLKN